MEKGSVVADEEEAGDGSNVEEETALILRRRTRVFFLAPRLVLCQHKVPTWDLGRTQVDDR